MYCVVKGRKNGIKFGGGGFSIHLPYYKNNTLMKKILIMFAAVAVTAFFTACEKEEGNDRRNPTGQTGNGSSVVLPGYDEPYMGWGATRSDVLEAVPYEFMTEDRTDDGILFLAFRGEKMIMNYLYMFEYGRLTASSAAVDLADAVTVAEFLVEKYLVVGGSDGTYVLCDDAMSLLVGVSISTSYMLVMYMPYENSSARLSGRMRALGADLRTRVDAKNAADTATLRSEIDRIFRR